MTHAGGRRRPPGVLRWDIRRTPYREFLHYAQELEA